MKKKGLDLNFLKDSPALKGDAEYYEFYHDYISPTLNKITSKQKNIHTIGLFGNWGSGKSTIIENLKEDYADSPLFLFDVWKYKGDPLRRTFLLKFFDFVDKKELWAKDKKLEPSYLDALYETTSSGETKKKEVTNPSKFSSIVKFIFDNAVLFALVFLLTGWLLLQLQLGEGHPFIHSLLLLVGLASQSTAFILIFGWILKKFVENLIDKLFESLNKDIETQTIIKTREYLNSPEQFEEKFLEIVAAINKKVIVVFDNIDRVQGNIAIEILSAIKTFIEPNEETNIVFIIPCDSGAIEEQVRNYYGKANQKNNIDPSEYLRKLFNVVIWTPDFIPTDLEDFTIKQIAQLGEDDGRLKGNDDLVKVVTKAFKSPREIKQFLNNLVAAVMIASSTDVWDEVSDNIAYLAKVLVLKQKFPKAFQRLKDKWYKPEDILPDDGDGKSPSIDDGENRQALRDFLTSTNTIQVVNAEPYIYFKASNSEKQFADSKELLPALVSENIDEVSTILSKNSSNQTKLINFILSLYTKYQSQEEILTKIVHTLLASLSSLGLELTGKQFYDHTAEVIEKNIWKNYIVLNTDDVFKMFILNTAVKKEYRDSLLQRYIAAFGSQELTQEDGHKIAQGIIRNLILVDDLSEEQIAQIKTPVEATYLDNINIVNTFKELKSQKRFVSKSAIEKHIQGIGIDNFLTRLPTITHYKEYLHELSSGNILVNTINVLIPLERAKNSDHNADKKILFESITNLTTAPQSILEDTDTALLATLEKEIILSYDVITDINSKGYIIPLMYRVGIYIHETNSDIEKQADGLIETFIKTASIDALNDVITSLNEDEAVEFVNFFSEQFEERSINSDPEEVSKEYLIMDSEHQQKFINALINQREDAGLPFIKVRETILPNRIATINNLIIRASKLPPSTQRDTVYEWVATSIKTTEDIVVKEKALSQMKELLKTDDEQEQQSGNRFFTSSKFPNKAQKTNIGEELLDWLTQEGKVVSQNHRFILKTILSLYTELSQTRQEQFLTLLFTLLGKPDDRGTNAVALEVIQELKLKWSKNKLHYEEFKESIAMWSNTTDRNYLITELLNNIKPEKPSKKEKIYWNSLEDIMDEDNK